MGATPEKRFARSTTSSAQVEVRAITETLDTEREFSRTRDLIRCPFCRREVWAYRWSRAGSGKRCPCGALLCRDRAYAPDPKAGHEPRRRP